MRYEGKLTKFDVIDLEWAKRANSRRFSRFSIQKYISDYESNLSVRDGYLARKQEAENRLTQAKAAPWYNLKAKLFDIVIAEDDVKFWNRRASNLGEYLGEYQNDYNKALLDAQKLERIKTKYTGSSTDEQEREEQFSEILSMAYDPIKLQGQRREAVKNYQAAYENYRNNFVNVKGLNMWAQEYISNSSNFARDVAICMTEEENEKLNVDHKAKRNYYEAKRSNQSTRTFIGKRLQKYYEAKRDKYERWQQNNERYRNANMGEISTAILNLINFRTLAKDNGFEELANEMIKKQENVINERNSNNQPIFKPSAVLEKNREFINAAIVESNEEICEIEQPLFEAVNSAEILMTNLDNEINEALVQINQRFDSSQNHTFVPLSPESIIEAPTVDEVQIAQTLVNVQPQPAAAE